MLQDDGGAVVKSLGVVGQAMHFAIERGMYRRFGVLEDIDAEMNAARFITAEELGFAVERPILQVAAKGDARVAHGVKQQACIVFRVGAAAEGEALLAGKFDDLVRLVGKAREQSDRALIAVGPSLEALFPGARAEP